MARQSLFRRKSFTFFEGLADNNSKDWFDEHRAEFTYELDEPFEELLEAVSDQLAGTDLPLTGGRATMFRINRDVRFGPDKSPYSTHVSGMLTRSGSKNEAAALVYVQIGVDGGLLAGGLHRPDAGTLAPLRRAMIDHPEAFVRVKDELERNGYALDRSEVLKTMPRGFAEYADHDLADDLRLKELIVTEQLSMTACCTPDLVQRVTDFALGVAPLLVYLEDNGATASRRR